MKPAWKLVFLLCLQAAAAPNARHKVKALQPKHVKFVNLQAPMPAPRLKAGLKPKAAQHKPLYTPLQPHHKAVQPVPAPKPKPLVKTVQPVLAPKPKDVVKFVQLKPALKPKSVARAVQPKPAPTPKSVVRTVQLKQGMRM